MRQPVRHVLAAAVAAFAALAGPSTVAADRPADAGPVRVDFAHPERFTDLRDLAHGRPGADDRALAELSRFVHARAAPRLAAGQSLEVRITDIDRAGEFEPRRGPSLDLVRVVRDVTPPRIDLSFRLLAADGSVVQSGARELRDLRFLSRHGEAPFEPLRHEKRLLADWLDRDLR